MIASYAAHHPTIIKTYAPVAPVLKVVSPYNFAPHAHIIKTVPVFKHSPILRYSSIHRPHYVKTAPFIKSGYASSYGW